MAIFSRRLLLRNHRLCDFWLVGPPICKERPCGPFVCFFLILFNIHRAAVFLLSLQSGQSTIDSMLFHTAGKLWRVSCQSGRTYSKLMYSVKGKEKKNCFVCPFALVVNTLWASTQQCRRLNKFPISKDRGKWPFAERSAIDTHNSSAAYYMYSRLFLSLSQSQKSMRLLLKALLQAFRETLFR